MSNELVNTQGAAVVPQHILDRQAARQGTATTSALQVTRGGGRKISIKGKVFSFPNHPTQPGLKLPLGSGVVGVIVGISPEPSNLFSKAYFGASYSEGSTDAPICSSEDGLVPDAQSDQPQCTTCAACPHSKFGTSIKDDGSAGKGKACSDSKILYMVGVRPVIDGKPHAPVGLLEAPLHQLSVPPTSFKALTQLGRDLAQHAIEMTEAEVVLSMADATSPQLDFAFSRYLEEQEIAAAEERQTSVEVRSLVSAKTDIEVAAPVIPCQLMPTVETVTMTYDPADAQAVAPLEQPLGNTEPDKDTTGAAWDPTIHSTSSDGQWGILTKAGVWKKRRGTANGAATTEPASTEAPPPPPAPPTESAQPASDPLQTANDLLSDAGWS